MLAKRLLKFSGKNHRMNREVFVSWEEKYYIYIYVQTYSLSQEYWASVGCVIWLPHNSEVGAGTMNPATFLRVLGPEPWNVCYAEPSVRPDDSRYGDNPNRVQRHTQFQVRCSLSFFFSSLLPSLLKDEAGPCLSVCLSLFTHKFRGRRRMKQETILGR